jgi:acetyltransferase-like isoleucine patch superfamily enzyme
LKKLSEQPNIHSSASVIDCELGAWTEVSADTILERSSLGDYSYVMQRCQIVGSSIGKFCSIASDVRLNPGNHPLERVTSHHMTYRAGLFGTTKIFLRGARRIQSGSGMTFGSVMVSRFCLGSASAMARRLVRARS